MSHHIVCEAIESRKLLRFFYKEAYRVVEPYTLALSKTDKLTLIAWRIRGFSKSDNPGKWRNFLLEEMSFIEMLNDDFKGPRPDYSPRPKNMKKVYCTY